MKTEAGYAQVAGVELTLFDCVRYFHKAGGINHVAQIVKDIGGKAKLKKLTQLAAYFENTNVRRLGYLLALTGHKRQANALVKADATRLKVNFIDVFTPMLDAQGQPREELFLLDRLHMNAAGSEGWKQAVRPYLDSDVKP